MNTDYRRLENAKFAMNNAHNPKFKAYWFKVVVAIRRKILNDYKSYR